MHLEIADNSSDSLILIAPTDEYCQFLSDNSFLMLLTIFVLACFVGYYLVWKVTPALHAPLMSVTNAISGIIILGAIIILGSSELNLSGTLGFVAIVITAINIFGGFAVTYRMLRMFRRKK